jgi:hypothetical protein
MPSALITLDPEAIAGWATGQGKPGDPAADLAASSEVREMIEGYLTIANQKLERDRVPVGFDLYPGSVRLGSARMPALSSPGLADACVGCLERPAVNQGVGGLPNLAVPL